MRGEGPDVDAILDKALEGFQAVSLVHGPWD